MRRSVSMTNYLLVLMVVAACGAEKEDPIVERLGWSEELAVIHHEFGLEAQSAGLSPRPGLMTAAFSDKMVRSYCPDDDNSVIGCCKWGFHFNNKLESGVYIVEELRNDPGLQVIARHEFAHCEYGVDHDDTDTNSIMFFAPDQRVDPNTGKPSEARLENLFNFIRENRGF